MTGHKGYKRNGEEHVLVKEGASALFPSPELTDTSYQECKIKILRILLVICKWYYFGYFAVKLGYHHYFFLRCNIVKHRELNSRLIGIAEVK